MRVGRNDGGGGVLSPEIGMIIKKCDSCIIKDNTMMNGAMKKLFIEENNVIHPLEIKKSAVSDRRGVKKYSVIDKTSLKHGNGGISYMCEEPILIDADNCFISHNLI